MCNIFSSQRGRGVHCSEGILPKNELNSAQHYQTGDKTRLVMPNINNINGDKTRLVMPVSPKE